MPDKPPIPEGQLCEYGCGQLATHFFPYVKKWCCLTNHSKCPAVKAKKENTCLERYGVRVPFELEEVRNKGEQTCLKRYGFRNASSSEVIKQKKIDKSIDKYGVEYPAQSEEVQNKMKKTTMINHGVEWPLQSKKVQDKQSQTCLERYGVSSVSQLEETKLKIEETSMKKYGVKYPCQSEEVKNNIKKSCLEKYGVEYISQVPEVIQKAARKMRLTVLKKLEKRLENGQQLTPNYNPAACTIIDNYSKQYGYNFQHAMNGGEFYIKELGYWVDAYDKDKNVVVEVDEPLHYDIDGNLLERDVRRQQEIMDFLKCEFIRIKVDNDNNIIGIARLNNEDVI